MNFSVPDVPIAFFDLDETVVDKDTNSLWLKWRTLKRRRLSLELLIGLYNYWYYKRGRLTERRMNFYFRARTVGIDPETYLKMARDFFDESGKHHIYTESLNLIKAHRQNGTRIVMITGQDDYVAAPFSAYLEMDGFISNRRILEKERFVGFERPNCYGSGKITLAEIYARQNGADLSDCAFYSDNISDLPLLQAVRHPIAVNPDPALETIARQSGWRIYRFFAR